MKNVALFGTCRVSSLNGDGLSLIDKTKSSTSASQVGLVYRDDLAVYEGQPFNYTTKLRDVIDSIRYLKGELFDGKISANTNKTFFSLFCRGFSNICFEYKECKEPGSWKPYDLIVAEINSLRQIIIKTNRFGAVFNGVNLPWNISLEPQHQMLNWSEKEFEIVEPTQALVDTMLGELLSLIECPLLIVGPYLLPEKPTSRTLFGDDDNVALDKVNSRRREVRQMLMASKYRQGFSYFDMTEHISNSPELLKNQYHFTHEGENILYNQIKSYL